MAACSPETLDFEIWDVFTDSAYSGNPLAIVFAADALDADQMQRMARQFNLSETIFVMQPSDPAHDARVRIFFPTAEIAFAGHPTIGCALSLAARNPSARRITLQEEAGLVPVTITTAGASPRAEFRAPVIPHPAPGAEIPDTLALAAAVGLPTDRICAGQAGVHQGGPRFLFIPLRSPQALTQARPVQPHWDGIMATAAVDSAYLYVHDGATIRARMFSPTAGIPEDPATGSAAAILAAQLLANRQLADGETRLSISQGVEMGRPSLIHLRVSVSGGAIRAVHVMGSAVPVASGTIRIPPHSPSD